MTTEPSQARHGAASGQTIVLIGMMGAGKSSVGRRLAASLGLPFLDADAEIEKAANATIEEIFATHGEAFFREGERRVIARLLSGRPMCWQQAAVPSLTRIPGRPSGHRASLSG